VQEQLHISGKTKRLPKPLLLASLNPADPPSQATISASATAMSFQPAKNTENNFSF
jgi:hypothetical protein